MTTGIILQARLGSTRLPGKVLALVGDRSLLELCVTRLALSDLPVVVATTDQPEDDAVERVARSLGVDVFRGSEQDVLGRYIAAASAFGLTDVIRATADNPCVDTRAARRTLTFRQRVGADHVIECGLPIGAAVECVSLDALQRAHAHATDPYDFEHVTSFIRRDNRFRALRAVAPGDIRRPGLRLTVDTAEDLEFIRQLYAGIGDAEPLPELSAIIRVADSLLVQQANYRRMRPGA